MRNIDTLLQLRLYTPKMKDFVKHIITISSDIREYIMNISLGL